MSEVQNVDHYCDTLSGGNHERCYVLLELFDHAEYDKLSERVEEGEVEYIPPKFGVFEDESRNIDELLSNGGIRQGHHYCILVEFKVHVNNSRVVLRFDFCLQVGKEPIPHEGNDQ